MSYLGTPLGYIFASIFLSMSASLTFYFGRFFDRGIAEQKYGFRIY
jgi:hypothetical protein